MRARCQFATILALLTLFVGVFPVAAQEASPAATTGEASLLAGLGFPDLKISSNGPTVELPAELPANRYRLVVANANPNLVTDLTFLRAPDTMALDDVVAFVESEVMKDTPSDAFFDFTFVGGTLAFPDSTNDAIVTLVPGNYAVMNFFYDAANADETFDASVASVVVTGELPAVTDPEAEVAVSTFEMTIEMPDIVPAGPHIWQVTNNGAFEHMVELNSVSGPVTREQVQATLNMYFEIPATPGAEPVEIMEEEPVAVGLLQVQSPQKTTWYEVDLAPGTYIAFCWVSGPGDVPTHALMGMFKIFTVE